MNPNVYFATVGLVPATETGWPTDVFGGFGQAAVSADDEKQAIIHINQFFQKQGFVIYSIEDMRTMDEYREVIDEIKEDPQDEEDEYMIAGFTRLSALVGNLSETNPVVFDVEGISLMDNYEQMAAFGKIDFNMLNDMAMWDASDDDENEFDDDDDDIDGNEGPRGGNDSGSGLRLRLS